jgi:hypothetical protein
MPMIEHLPQGDPCSSCGEAAARHRPARAWHKTVGDPCTKCGRAAFEHPGKDRLIKRKAYDVDRDDRKAEQMIVGIDGEGYDTPEGRHIYVYLAAVDETGRTVGEAWNPAGLSHEECATMLLALPEHSLKFGYMFSYDTTKILQDLPKEDIFRLFRPDFRRERRCKDCGHHWTLLTQVFCPNCKSENVRSYTPHMRLLKRGYSWMHGKFTIASDYRKTAHGKRSWKKSVAIWDCFRFFGGPFVRALKDWDVGTPEQRARILEMKQKRGSFTPEMIAEVKTYCKEECHLLAVMMRKVLNAHDDAGIPLKGSYYGVGSTASALLKKYHVADYRGPALEELDRGLAYAILCAYVGGRFENSGVGRVTRHVYGFDVASAYPYALSFLPCLKCGKWEWIQGSRLLYRVERADLAICKYKVVGMRARDREKLAWAPLPHRDEDGSITYPVNHEGWAWAQEMLPALAGWPDLVRLESAWIYRTRCSHAPWSFIPGTFKQRIAWGKEGKGLTLKGGMNASYGKTAQRKGERPPFQSWPWAGACTATTRGQILKAISSAKDPWNVLAIATDGIFCLEQLNLPAPEDTGTSGLVGPDGNEKPALGSWEQKDYPEGAFMAKPGMYFRLRPKEAEDVRARGLGRRELFEQLQLVLKGWDKWNRKDFDYAVPLVSRRFHGAKSSVLALAWCGRERCRNKKTKSTPSWVGVPEQGCPQCREIGLGYRVGARTDENGKEIYGQWSEVDVDLGFDPFPKRERRVARGDYSRLFVRDLGGAQSQPYTGTTSPLGMMARESEEMALEQPEWGEFDDDEPE